MKKKLYGLCYLSMLLAFKQVNDPSAINKVLKTIDAINSFQANFIYTIQTADKKKELIQEPIQGKIWVKDNKYHLLLDEQEVICNGQLIWTYLPQAQEVQINRYAPEQEYLDPIKLLTLYHTNFIPANLKKQSIHGKNYDCLTFVASEPEQWLKEIMLTVDQKTKQIKHLEALDTDGACHIFQITQFETKKDLAERCFEFDVNQYPDIEVIDLR